MNRPNEWHGILQEFSEFLPINENTPDLSLNEGDTPLVIARNIPDQIGFRGSLYFKIEGLNPSGSFKDRGMVVAVAKALEEGSEAIICASTGNTAASAAAYAARAGIQAIVLLPKGRVAQGKLAQALLYGAIVVQVDGNFDAAQRIVKEIAQNYPVTMVNSLNPFRLQGQKTASLEIMRQLGSNSPDFHFIPVGNGGNITAYWMGYQEGVERRRDLYSLTASGLGTEETQELMDKWTQELRLPRMMGYQAEGAAPIVNGQIVENPQTVASAICIGNPARWQEAENAILESAGHIDSVTDEEILSAYELLAQSEGIYCEPASAVSLSGFLKAYGQGLVPDKNNIVVCTLTGSGLKDPDTALEQVGGETLHSPADTDRVISLLGL